MTPLSSIALGTIVSFGIGMIWYSPLLFGQVWAKGMGFTAKSMKAAQKKMGPMYGLSLAATVVQTIVLGSFLKMTGGHGVAVGVMAGFLAWLGFIFPTQLTDKIFGNMDRPWNVFWINISYQLTQIVAIGAVLGWFLR